MKLVGILAAVLLTVGAAVALGSNSGGDDPPPVALGGVRLVSVDSCDELLDWYQTVARQTDAGALSGYGFGFGGDMLATGGSTAVGRAAAPMAAAEDAATQATTTPAHSDTNIQERGVDEPDTVKTNGKILVNATADALEVVDVTGDAPVLVSTMPLEPGGTEILLTGDRVLTLTNVWRQDPNAAVPPAEGDRVAMIMPVQGKPVTVITSIDVSDPAHPREVERRELEGSYRTARVTGTTARVVLVSTPQIPAPGPAVYETPDGAAQQQRLTEWKSEVISSMTLDDWAPIAERDCSSVARTSQPEGLATTSVLTLDAAGSLDVLDTDSVVADAGTVYASPDRLYIATSRWSQTSNPSGEVRTELHAFDISGAESSYVGSGAAPGYLLNQFALSEHEGHLRVATTQEAPWDETSQSQPTHSGIVVLDEQNGTLAPVGHIDGLGVTERIQAVRYLGDTAYVVTFRQKDPLFVIDLSDPTAPRVAGELKVPGYSAYLHPIDDGRLLGIGQDATDDGQVLGTQIATFAVDDPAAPSRIDALRIDHGTSAVEYDHRAFLWWNDTRTVVVPIEIYDPGVIEPMPMPEQELCAPESPCTSPASPGDATVGAPPPNPTRPFMGAVVFAVGTDGSLTEIGRVSHESHSQPDGYNAVSRSLVIGDALYTLSAAGVLKSDLSSLADEGFAAFPAPSNQGQPIPIEG